MPTYCYRLSDGSIVSLTMTVVEMESRQQSDGSIILEDGKKGDRDYPAEYGGPRRCATWPMISDALGVAPDQVTAARQQAQALGIPTEFTREGRAILTGPGHRKRLCRALGFYDKNAGYGDPAPDRTGAPRCLSKEQQVQAVRDRMRANLASHPRLRHLVAQ